MSYFSRFKGAFHPLLAQAGLSLLETAVALIVVGLIVVPVLRVYQANMIKEAYENSVGDLSRAIEGINQYFASGNGAYPCPADLSLQEGDANFGYSGNCADLASIQPCPSTTWLSNGGICKTTGSDPVIIGGLPFASLKMAEEDSVDFWHNKYIYAVSHRQTDIATYITDNGSIRVIDVRTGSPAMLVDSSSSPILHDMFIFSTGESGVGGYTKKGTPLTACGNDNIRYEYENCDFDSTFFALEGTNSSDELVSAYSKVISTSFFDDITRMQEFMPANTWYQHEDNPSYIDIDFVLTQATKVGIGTTTPDTPFNGATLMVVGDIRADVTTSPEGGHVESDAVCDEDDTDCFDPRIITGNETDMNCFSDGSYSSDPAVSRAVKRIANSSVGCGSGIDSSGNTIDGGETLKVDPTIFGDVTCPSGQIAKGINASGDLECVALTTP